MACKTDENLSTPFAHHLETAPIGAGVGSGESLQVGGAGGSINVHPHTPPKPQSTPGWPRTNPIGLPYHLNSLT